jgi:hypothetical protein
VPLDILNMATIWLTYAWDDNLAGDVDFISQEIVRAGVQVKLDRWNISAGKRLWDQIANFIQDPKESDGWALYASQASLGSEACREEFAYALDRALHTRGSTFPIIGLFPGPVDTSLVPAAVKVRLCVSTTDPDWKERIKAAVEGRPPSVAHLSVDPYQVRIHQASAGAGRPYAIEVRPRAGTWSPFFAAIPITEKESLNPSIWHGPANRPGSGGMLTNTGECTSDDGQWWIMYAQNEATPTQSYFLFVNKLPTQIAFGVHNGQPQYLYLVPAPGKA